MKSNDDQFQFECELITKEIMDVLELKLIRKSSKEFIHISTASLCDVMAFILTNAINIPDDQIYLAVNEELKYYVKYYRENKNEI